MVFGKQKTMECIEKIYQTGFLKTGTVGAIAVSESDPNVVVVGMGEHAARGVMSSMGDGVYKSDDAEQHGNT